MFLAEERSIDAFQAGATVTFNVGELAQAPDFIATKLAVTIGSSPAPRPVQAPILVVMPPNRGVGGSWGAFLWF